MDWILLIVPGVIWGASFLFIAEGLEAMGPNGVTFTRILVGFLTLALVPGSRRAIRRDDWVGTALVGLLWMAFPLSLPRRRRKLDVRLPSGSVREPARAGPSVTRLNPLAEISRVSGPPARERSRPVPRSICWPRRNLRVKRRAEPASGRHP